MPPETPKVEARLLQATIAVHGGERTEEQPFGPVVSPVFHSATFGFHSFDETRRYARGELPETFSRYANPKVDSRLASRLQKTSLPTSRKH